MGSELGPLNAEQLIEMVRHHQITPEDLVRRNQSRWVPAYQVKGLFEAAAKPPKPPAKPAPAAEPAFDHSARSDFDAIRDLASSSASHNGDASAAGRATTAEAAVSEVEKPFAEPRDDWYCIASGEKLGPLSFRDLKSLARDGQLRNRDRVWRASAPKWQKASEVEGLDWSNRL